MTTQTRTAVVLGGTGETGKSLLRLLSTSPSFTNVRAIARRPIANHDTVVRPDMLDVTPADFSLGSGDTGKVAVFCAIGTTRSKAGSAEEFARVDHDLVIHLAKQARLAGVTDFHLVSSSGADSRSWWLYPRTKGLVEAAVALVGFHRVVIYRPGLLLLEGGGGGRAEWRVLEWMARWVAPAVEYLQPGRFCISTDHLARAMVRLAHDSGAGAGAGGVRIVENREIYKLAHNV